MGGRRVVSELGPRLQGELPRAGLGRKTKHLARAVEEPFHVAVEVPRKRVPDVRVLECGGQARLRPIEPGGEGERRLGRRRAA